MHALNFDTGVEEIPVNGGRAVLRVNLSDPNLYDRFTEVTARLQALIAEYEAAAKDLEVFHLDEKGWPVRTGDTLFEQMRALDVQVKEQLRYLLGEQNDLDAVFDGVNLLAVGVNGKYVLENFLDALSPLIGEGAENLAQDHAADAKAQAAQNRAARRAAAKK